MTAEQLYQFDLNGYVVVPAAIDSSHLRRLLVYWSEHLTGNRLHDVNFDWGEEWRALIDLETVFPFLDEVFRSRFRLDHMFCVDERFVSSGGRLHHQADMFDEGIYYWVRNQRVHSGLVAVQYVLSDVTEAQSHFCCIPGSHRANFPVPGCYREVEGNPMLRHLFLRAGDVLIFSEALVHGTYVVPSSGPRRSVFARYMNNHSYFRKPSDQRPIHALPATPNHAASATPAFRVDRLTPRQYQLVVEPAYARGHAAIGG
ncbi:phytanoyl-CoA dioxygenase family protein [Stenotrophomonas rhizophila]|nr:phytanoyl-CoA dioxygenase family protein [Stenotrophomonas rhizophila]MCC7634805.1 phytanoyl-CoA dioxygenase family protein [Stenotrophomonas rhizophila]MCC7664522.1 phytanoyl-CoA dioxygenase family protein [Stenotrophomonas rhizophila]